MAFEDPLTSSALELASAIRERRISSNEVLTAYLDQVAAVNPRLNAIVTLDEEGARSAARAADEAVDRGDRLGRLHGVPFSVKDVIATRGLRTTAGSLTLADHVPAHSATAVERLQRDGAILLGKTNCPEYAFDIDTDNRLFGRTRNPWSAEHTPGGSSGGESAAVAAGCSALGIGTDYGGSIRWPAHCTGLVSLRPSGGIVPGSGQMPYTPVAGLAAAAVPPPNSMSLQSQLQRIAPIARSVDDLWEAVRVMAGPDGIDGQAVPVALGDPATVDVSRLACSWWGSDGAAPVEPQIARVVEDAAGALRDRGVDVRHELPPGLAEAEPVFQQLRAAEGVPDHQDLAAGREEQLTANIHAWFAANQGASVREYRLLAAERDLLRARLLAHLSDRPLILLPVGSVPAFRHDAREFQVEGVEMPRLSLISCCRAISVMNLPAATVPCGTSADGLPIGVQIVGRPFRDHEVIAAARLLEESFGPWRPSTSNHAGATR